MATWELQPDATDGKDSSGEYSEYCDQADYGYDSITGAQIRAVEPSAPGNPGTITRTVYDQMGRQASTWAGTQDTPTGGFDWRDWSPTNNDGTDMVQIAANEYDNIHRPR